MQNRKERRVWGEGGLARGGGNFVVSILVLVQTDRRAKVFPIVHSTDMARYKQAQRKLLLFFSGMRRRINWQVVVMMEFVFLRLDQRYRTLPDFLFYFRGRNF